MGVKRLMNQSKAKHDMSEDWSEYEGHYKSQVTCVESMILLCTKVTELSVFVKLFLEYILSMLLSWDGMGLYVAFCDLV